MRQKTRHQPSGVESNRRDVQVLSSYLHDQNFQKIVAKAGTLSLERVTPHSLRHAFASHAIDGEADLIVLKAVLGHASLHDRKF